LSFFTKIYKAKLNEILLVLSLFVFKRKMSRILLVSALLVLTQFGESQAAAFTVRQNRFDDVPNLQTPAPVASSTKTTKKAETG